MGQTDQYENSKNRIIISSEIEARILQNCPYLFVVFLTTYFRVKNKRNINIKSCEKNIIILCVNSASLMKNGEDKS